MSAAAVAVASVAVGPRAPLQSSRLDLVSNGELEVVAMVYVGSSPLSRATQ